MISKLKEIEKITDKNFNIIQKECKKRGATIHFLNVIGDNVTIFISKPIFNYKFLVQKISDNNYFYKINMEA